jgi:hypothetical protein
VESVNDGIESANTVPYQSHQAELTLVMSSLAAVGNFNLGSPRSAHDQLGRSVMAYLARRAGTSVLLMKVRRSVDDRECPPIIAASGPCVARARTRGLFVSKPARDVAYHHSYSV